MAQHQREYPSDARQIAPMRAFFREVYQASGQIQSDDESLVSRLELALTEAASNIILHGGSSQQHKSISLSIEADDEQVCLTLKYRGKPFNPRSAAEPVFDGSRENGFGLYLIRKCVDEVQFSQDAQGLCAVHMVQKRKQRQTVENHETHG